MIDTKGGDRQVHLKFIWVGLAVMGGLTVAGTIDEGWRVLLIGFLFMAVFVGVMWTLRP